MSFLSYFVFTLLATAASAAPGSRIVGGTPTTIEEFPYIVSLEYTYPAAGVTVQRCVGGLLSSYHVLTTAFCFTGAINENMRVRAGSTSSLAGGTLVSLGQVIKHPLYQESARRGDVAVTFLSQPLGVSSVINVLYLPPQGMNIPDGFQVKVVSWGFEYIGGPQLERLKTIELNKVGLEECAAAYAGNEEVEISDAVLCATSPTQNTCAGDSGAPMVIEQTLVGIASYFEDCEGSHPDVFTRVDRYTDWILAVATAPSSGLVGRNTPLVTA